jgi:DNA-binding winged helix-turn-helix (wHTH) protein
MIDAYVCYFRKILRNEIRQKYIETVYGRGYMINDPDPAEAQQRIAADTKPLLLESFDVKSEMKAEEIQTEAYVS